jgi:hypothetical protein
MTNLSTKETMQLIEEEKTAWRELTDLYKGTAPSNRLRLPGSPYYQQLYHRWFLLRDEGAKRGLWLFIPPSERKREMKKM